MFESICLLLDYVYIFFTGIGEIAMLSFEDLLQWLLGGELINVTSAGLSGEIFQFSIGSLDFFNQFNLDIEIGDVSYVAGLGTSLRLFVFGLFEFLFYTPIFPLSTPFFILSIVAIFRIFIFVVMWDFAWKIIDLILKALDIVIPL